VLPFGGSWTSTLSLATIGSKSTAGDAISALADSGVNPFHATSQISPAISATVLGGSQLNLVGATDLTGGILLCTFFFTAPRDYIDVGFVSSGGIQEEFAKLVERRMQESAGHDDEKGGAFRQDDEKQLQWIKETFLPFR